MAGPVPDARLAEMEQAPRLDVSRPSGLRLAAFALSAAGALIIGVGCFLPWVTYGIRFPGDTPTVVPGSDDVAGRIALLCAALILLAVVGSRLLAPWYRRPLGIVLTAAGVVTVAVTTWFVVTVADRYAAIQPIPGQASSPIESYVNVGPGAWVVIAGGLLAIAGGILTLRWADLIMHNPGPLPPH